MRTGDELIPGSWGQEIDLVFHGQHRRIRGHQRVGRIATSAIGDCSRNARVEIVVLLRELSTVRRANLDAPWVQFGYTGAKVLHQALALKTIQNSFGKIGVDTVKAKFVHTREYSHTRQEIPKTGISCRFIFLLS